MITTNLKANIQIGFTDNDCLDVLQPIRLSMSIGGATFQDYLSPEQAVELADELLAAAAKCAKPNKMFDFDKVPTTVEEARTRGAANRVRDRFR